MTQERIERAKCLYDPGRRCYEAIGGPDRGRHSECVVAALAESGPVAVLPGGKVVGMEKWCDECGDGSGIYAGHDWTRKGSESEPIPVQCRRCTEQDTYRLTDEGDGE